MFFVRFRLGRSGVALIAIFVLALGLRAGWSWRADTVTPPLSDPQYYQATAVNVAEGRGYSVRLDQPTIVDAPWGFAAGPGSEATAFWAPGYPFVLAALYKLFGVHIALAKALNVLAGALTVFPVFYLGARLRPRSPRGVGLRAGLIAALMVAVAPAYVFWSASLFSESLFTLGVASTLAVALWAGERRSFAAYFVTGIVLTLTAFVRAQGLLFVVPVLVLLAPPVEGSAMRDRASQQLRALVMPSARIAVPVLLAIVLLVVPWAIRNDVAMGAPSIISGSGGYNLREGNAPYANGTTTVPRDLWDERPGISFHEREIFWEEVGARRAVAYARSHPGREVELARLRVGWLLRSDAEQSMRWSESLGMTPVGRGRDALVLIGDVSWYGLIAVAGLSMLVAKRDRVWLACWAATGIWILFHIAFFGEPRYHIPLLPALAVLAADSVIALSERIKQRRSETSLAAALTG